MHRRILYWLTYLAAAMSLGHHLDHWWQQRGLRRTARAATAAGTQR
ncbi:MAG TPA: hypothetical protein VFM54_05990 [Micromonosporaceae bacterium]|nr:hypothetical protein [Micromonosporaceae bacterium]